ncbi:class II aldolase/adducin family protein [Pseudomonas citronellolis]|uniref:class II aldolase/adducin family protein n=1 Tax=Pseudomonas citronellolis TaxID=53408 RepID=UPI00389A020A
MAHELTLPHVRDQVSDEEWQLRVNLAACYRLVALFGWTDLVFTHISARVPGPEHHFLINPYGLLFDEITASNLVKIDQDGNKVIDSPYDANRAGFVIHSAIHAARHDIQCVLPISQQSTFVLSSLAYHDYEGVALRDDEKPRLQADLGNKLFFMLRNHGLLTVGRSVADAFLNMYTFETTCQIQLAAQAGGQLVQVDPQIIDGVAEVVDKQTGGQGGDFVWPALLRRLNRIDTSYRD